MCEYYRHDCDNCPMSIMNNGYDRLCTVAIEQYPDRAVEIVQEWSDEHPTKTRLDDLLEKYPRAKMSDLNTPYFYPYLLGYCNECDACKIADKRYVICWDEPVDGGATGKAVE
jgi:hypothetical protein